MGPEKVNFRIILNTPTKEIYSAGDRVSGRVCFTSDDDQDVGKVVVQFWGRSKSKVYRRDGYGNRLTFRGRGNLFCESVVLYDGQYTHKAPNFEWPFEFLFPERAQRTTYGDTWKSGHAIFRGSDQADSVLLPSKMATKGQTLKIVHNFDCFVEYKLQASMTSPRNDKPYCEDEISLRFVQVCQDDSVSTHPSGLASPKAYEIRSYKLDPQYSGRSLSMKERARTILGSTSVPSANFQVTLDALSAVRLGVKTALTLELNHLAQSSSTSPYPAVSLQSVSVTILATTHARSRKAMFRCREGSSEREVPCDVGLQTNSKLWSGPFTKDTAFTKQLPLDDFHALGIVPSFATYNIARTYSIKTQCIFECAGKEVKFQRQEKLEVLPGSARNMSELAQYISRPGSIAESSIFDAELQLGDSMEQLPRYESDRESLSSDQEVQAPSQSEKSAVLQN